jgi:ribosomal protein S18 acetylase RimI-like enzyme
MIGAGSKVNVRRAKATDSERLAEIFAQSWRLAYRGIIPHPHLECMIQRRGVSAWAKSIRTEAHLLVVEAAGEVAGYATCGASRHHGAYKGEIYELYLEPVYQGLGLGEFLFEACRNQLDRRGLDGLMVWVLEDNTSAADFYYRRGGRPISRATEKFGNVKLGKISYGWR